MFPGRVANNGRNFQKLKAWIALFIYSLIMKLEISMTLLADDALKLALLITLRQTLSGMHDSVHLHKSEWLGSASLGSRKDALF